MKAYRATMAFSVGLRGMKIVQGMVVRYDGQQVQIGNAPPFPCKILESAIQVGWLEPLPTRCDLITEGWLDE